MFLMHKKISAKEKIVGFYSTWPKIKAADTEVDALFRRYVHHPVLALIDVRPHIEGLPVQAYQTVERSEGGTTAVRTFVHIPAEVGAFEAEEVGVEHLLRDINDPTVSTLAGDLRQKLVGLRGLSAALSDVSQYLGLVVAGRLPVNNEILYHVQTLLATIPAATSPEVVSALQEVTNDQHLALYMAAVARSVLALHDLVVNKIKRKDDDTGDAKEKTPADGKAAAAGDGKAGDGKAGAGAAGDGKAGGKGAGSGGGAEGKK